MPDNRPKAETYLAGTCPILMTDQKACGRPILDPKPKEDVFYVCLMHSLDCKKNMPEFLREIDAILLNKPSNQRPTDKFDMSGFVFPKAFFHKEIIQKEIDFSWARFEKADFSKCNFKEKSNFVEARFADADFKMARLHNPDFSGAKFKKVDFSSSRTEIRSGIFRNTVFEEAHFEHTTLTRTNFQDAEFLLPVSFSEATFQQSVDFRGASFRQSANFLKATFHSADFRGVAFHKSTDFRRTTFFQEGDFNLSWFLQPADFRYAKFLEPKKMGFRQVNQPRKQYKGMEPGTIDHCGAGFQAYFTDCNMEEVVFEDINWHKLGRRMALQDELDIRKGKEHNHELVAIAYRRLTNNFEKTRDYHRVEDCFVGLMEMKRLDPNNFLWGRHDWAKKLYTQFKALRKFGELVSVTNFYRIFSNYGSSYTQAFLVLFGLLGTFGILYSIPSFGLAPTNDMAFLEGPYLEGSYTWQRLLDGLLYAFEVITFTREPTFTVTNYLGKAVRILETILVPAQLALFFLALRRRFRR